MALGASMCLLVAIQFIRKTLHMYRATRLLRLGHYTNLLTREGIIYFLVYVYVIYITSNLQFHEAYDLL